MTTPTQFSPELDYGTELSPSTSTETETVLAAVEGVTVSIISPEAIEPIGTNELIETETFNPLEAIPDTLDYDPEEPHLDLTAFLEDTDFEVPNLAPQSIILAGDHHATPQPTAALTPEESRAAEPDTPLGHLAARYERQITGDAA